MSTTGLQVQITAVDQLGPALALVQPIRLYGTECPVCVRPATCWSIPGRVITHGAGAKQCHLPPLDTRKATQP